MIRPPNIVNIVKQSLSLYPLPTTCYVLTLCSYIMSYITVSKRRWDDICQTHGQFRLHMKLMAHDHMPVLMENRLLEAHSATGQLLLCI